MTESYVLSTAVMGVLLIGGVVALAQSGRLQSLVPRASGETGSGGWIEHARSSRDLQLSVALAIVVVGALAVVAGSGEAIGLPGSVVSAAEFVVTGLAIAVGLFAVVGALVLVSRRLGASYAEAIGIGAALVGTILVLAILYELGVTLSSLQDGFGL